MSNPYSQELLNCLENLKLKNGHEEVQDEFYNLAAITREPTWNKRSNPGSGSPDLEIVSLETEDPTKTMKEFCNPKQPWAIKFREFAHTAVGIDFAVGARPPLNESFVGWNNKL